MQVANIAVWDLETGGLKHDRDAVVEIAMVVLDSTTLEIVDRYESIIAPYKLKSGVDVLYDPKALAYNGISMSKIQSEGRDAKQVAKEIQAFCKKHKKGIRGGNGKLISCGHNIEKFDIPFLETFLGNFSVKYDDLFVPWPLDTLWMTRLKWSEDGSIKDHKLETACNGVGIQLIDAHRAMNDVEANADLVKSFLLSLRQQGGFVEQKKERPRETFRF